MKHFKGRTSWHCVGPDGVTPFSWYELERRERQQAVHSPGFMVTVRVRKNDGNYEAEDRISSVTIICYHLGMVLLSD